MIMLFDQQYATEVYARNPAMKAEKEGRKAGFLAALVSLVNKGLLRAEDAAEQAGISVEAFERERQRLG